MWLKLEKDKDWYQFMVYVIFMLRYNGHKQICFYLLTFLLLAIALFAAACDAEQNVMNISTNIPIIASTATIKPLASIPPLTATSQITPPSQSLTITATNVVTNLPSNLNIATKTIISSQDWQYRWLKSIPCLPPCFEGITPGKTTAQEALEILKKNPLITDAKLLPPQGEYSYVVWNWVGITPQSAKGSSGGNLFYETRSSNQLIYLIWPFFSTSFKLSDIIKAYGDPSHVIVGYETHQGQIARYYIYIIYLMQGFVVSIPENNPIIPIISSDLLLEKPQFFIPNADGLEKIKPSLFSKNLLVSWQGFKDFRFYCREFENVNGTENCNKALGSP